MAPSPVPRGDPGSSPEDSYCYGTATRCNCTPLCYAMLYLTLRGTTCSIGTGQRSLEANVEKADGLGHDHAGSAAVRIAMVLAHAYDRVEIPPTKMVTTRVNLFRAILPERQDHYRPTTCHPARRLAPASSRSSPIFTAARWSDTRASPKWWSACSA
jgi:hypothetical protein